MDKSATQESAWFEGVKQQGRIAMVGLLVVVVPLVFVGNTIDQLRKAVHKALVAFEPRVQELGGTTIAILILLALLICAWLIGLLMTRTELGQRVLEWEKRVFTKHSSALKKQAGREKTAEEAAARAALPGHAGLANVLGGWQPCVIVDDSQSSLTSVFVPDLPSTETGSLYVVEADRVRPLDMPMKEFRATLKTRGHGAKQWVAALAATEH
jgi:uncharacterized membrane protein